MHNKTPNLNPIFLIPTSFLLSDGDPRYIDGFVKYIVGYAMKHFGNQGQWRFHGYGKKLREKENEKLTIITVINVLNLQLCHLPSMRVSNELGQGLLGGMICGLSLQTILLLITFYKTNWIHEIQPSDFEDVYGLYEKARMCSLSKASQNIGLQSLERPTAVILFANLCILFAIVEGKGWMVGCPSEVLQESIGAAKPYLQQFIDV
uniref:Uncharacterized protein n=1 Tax=Cucumis melo TaxID=3656 RepID=A0A9I9EGD8_CUCME